jgi:hypothetical protein
MCVRRWARLEKSMKQQLDSQLDYFERQLHVSSRDPMLSRQSTLLIYTLLKITQQDLKGNRPGHIIAGDLESDDDKHKPKDDGRVKHLESEVRGVVFAAVCKHFIILCECGCS